MNSREETESTVQVLPAQVPTTPATFSSVLARRPVRFLWLASLISYLGDTFGVMALFILLNDVTHSTMILATVGLVQTLPLFLGIVAGTLVDRWRYRPVLLTTDLLRAVLTPLYALFTSDDGLLLVLIVVAATSLASRFFDPASQALRRALLEPEEFQVAASLWQATIGISFVVGPLLAGLTISAFGGVGPGTTVAFLVDSLSFLLSAIIIFVGVSREARAVDKERQAKATASALTELRQGWRLMWLSKPVRGVLVLYGVGLLGVGSVFVLVVPYVQTVFGGGPFEIGLLDTVQALGLAAGAVSVGAVLATRWPAGNLMLGASFIGAFAVIGLGLAPIYVLALAAMLVAGAAAGTLEAAGSTVVLHEVPQQHQGKATATLDTILNGAYVISIALAGVGGDTIGIRTVFIAGGLVALLGVAGAAPLLWHAGGPVLDGHPADSATSN